MLQRERRANLGEMPALSPRMFQIDLGVCLRTREAVANAATLAISM